MIVVLKRGAEQDKREQLINWLKNQGLGVHISEGEYQTVLGLIGDTARVDMDLIESLSIVDSVKRVTEPFKCCNRKFHPDDMIVQVGDVKVGGGNFCMIAGPCSVESEEQIVAVAKAVKAPSLTDTLLNIVPINPMEAMAKGSMLQIIFFAVIFGFGLASLGERGKPVLRFFEIVGDVMIRVTGYVMMYAPIGVFGLIAFTVAKHGLAVLLPLFSLILTSFIATVVLVFAILIPMVMFLGKTGPAKFLKGIFEPWLVAFTTCSSAAALPANLKAARKLGATKSIASFSIPLGNTVNMNGTAVYMGVCAIFAAEVFGIHLTFTDQLTVVLMGVLAAIGTAGVPGAGLIMTTVVFTQVGIPLEAVALIAGIDRILDMIRTSINVVGDVASAVVVTSLEGDLNTEPYQEGEA